MQTQDSNARNALLPSLNHLQNPELVNTAITTPNAIIQRTRGIIFAQKSSKEMKLSHLFALIFLLALQIMQKGMFKNWHKKKKKERKELNLDK